MQTSTLRVRPLVEPVAFAVPSWAVGVAAYAVCLALFSRTLSVEDAVAAALYSAIVFFPLAAILYVPVVWCVSRFLQPGPRWPLALIGFALAPVAVAALNALWSGRCCVPSLSPENLLFGIAFAAAGAAFAPLVVE